jgi:hypothetical protein
MGIGGSTARLAGTPTRMLLAREGAFLSSGASACDHAPVHGPIVVCRYVVDGCLPSLPVSSPTGDPPSLAGTTIHERRTHMKRTLLVAVAAASLPIALQAQNCLGLASHASTPTNLTVGALFTDGAKGIDGRFGFGSSIGFGGISASVLDYDDVDGTAKAIGGDVGLSYLVPMCASAARTIRQMT